MNDKTFLIQYEQNAMHSYCTYMHGSDSFFSIFLLFFLKEEVGGKDNFLRQKQFYQKQVEHSKVLLHFLFFIVIEI